MDKQFSKYTSKGVIAQTFNILVLEVSQVDEYLFQKQTYVKSLTSFGITKLLHNNPVYNQVTMICKAINSPCMNCVFCIWFNTLSYCEWKEIEYK